LHLYWVWLAIASGITFLLYAFDKTQARISGWRVPEIAFHILTLSGGFPGGWAGRLVFRHKTKKGIFMFVLVVSTAIHLGLEYWLFIR
jgi:uncharacterized membrane protein YsdA (DUF1294 family)